MTKKLGVAIDDPLLEQSLYQELFEVCLKELVPVVIMKVTSDELNVIMLVGLLHENC